MVLKTHLEPFREPFLLFTEEFTYLGSMVIGLMEELRKTSQIDSTKPELHSACLVMYGGPSNIELRPSSRYIRAASSLLSCTALNVGG